LTSNGVAHSIPVGVRVAHELAHGPVTAQKTAHGQAHFKKSAYGLMPKIVEPKVLKTRPLPHPLECEAKGVRRQRDNVVTSLA
jgi:hypothetical protein